MGIKRIISALTLVICIAGCGPRFNFEGTWQGERQVQLVENADPTIGRTLSKVQLTIKSNDDYVLVDGGLPSAGHLNRIEKGAELDPTKVYDRSIERQPPETQVRFRGTTITIENGTLRFMSKGGGTAILKREPTSG